MLIHTINWQWRHCLAQHWDKGCGGGNLFWDKTLGLQFHLAMDKKLHFCAVNGWKELNKERRSNNFWPLLSERISKYCIWFHSFYIKFIKKLIQIDIYILLTSEYHICKVWYWHLLKFGFYSGKKRNKMFFFFFFFIFLEHILANFKILHQISLFLL